MKIRIKYGFKATRGELKAGEIIDVKPRIAKQWVEDGKAVYVKIVDEREIK